MTITPSVITFTPSNWATPQTVKVSFSDDNIYNDIQTVVLHNSLVGGPSYYDGTFLGDVFFRVYDNDELSVTGQNVIFPLTVSLVVAILIFAKLLF